MKSGKQIQSGAKWSLLVVFIASVIVLVKILNAAAPQSEEETSPTHEDEELRSRFYNASLPHAVRVVQGLLQEQKAHGQPWKIDSYGATTGDTQQINVKVPFFALTSDFSVTLRNDSDGAVRVDCASASRFGKSDFGQNKRNITQFLKALDAVLKV